MPADWSWLEPTAPVDVPLVFVPQTDADWPRLPGYWNVVPAAPLGLPTLHFGLGPLNALSAWRLAEDARAVKIKVPRGLPDPTPSLPTGNPPTLGKWQLGKKLFFADILAISSADKTSCASCHRPEHGFADDWATNRLGNRNTLSLINVVYHKHFFWDGRADSLEQTIVRDPKDEKLPPGQRATRHAWGGVISAIREDKDYRREFQQVFGIRQPTQDAIAQALATYLRTILSGNSLLDRAEKSEKSVTADALEAILDDGFLKSAGPLKPAEAAQQIVEGRELFHGKARCQRCHPAPLYFDGDFHNIGLEDNDIRQILGENLGRFDFVPVGLKEARLRGAFRTPSLRALPRTGPYMHQGKLKSLSEVVEFFDRGISARSNRFLARALLDEPGQVHALDLDARAKASLALFLRALDGDPVDSILIPLQKP